MASHPPWYVLVVAAFFFVFWAGYWVVHVLALFYARWRLYARLQPRAASGGGEDPWPGVTILKPLVGVDRNLPSNLETFFTMSYPGPYELLFCVADDGDPALGVCKMLKDKYPGVDCRIFVGGEKVGENPKINNMEPGCVSPASSSHLLLHSFCIPFLSFFLSRVHLLFTWYIDMKILIIFQCSFAHIFVHLLFTMDYGYEDSQFIMVMFKP
jgi:cellulose synthase/poly-beta-1,6-N-acetylglucosamine synthase-like glycosyltransferase